MSLVEKIKEVNWKITGALFSVPLITDIIPHIIEKNYSYFDKREMIELGLETLLLTGVGVYISKKNNENKKQQQKFKELAESISDIFFAMDKDLKYTYWNKATEVDSGLSNEEAIGKTIEDIFPKSDVRDNLKELYKNVIKTKESEQIILNHPFNNKLIHELTAYPTIDGVSVFVKDITERNNMDIKLKEKDELFKKLSDNVPGMLYQFMKKTDGTFSVPFTTHHINNIFGCSPEDVKNDFSPISKVIYPDDLKKVIDSIEYSAKNLTQWQCEYRIQLPGESIKWLLGNSMPEKLKDGSIVWSGFNTDITERKNLEEEVYETNELFSLFMKHTPIYKYIKEVKENKSLMLYASENFEQIIGIPSSKLKGKTMDELFPKEIASKITTDDINVALTGKLSILEEEINGRYYKTRKFPIFHKTKTLIAGYTIDITERKINEEKIKESELKYHNLIEMTNTGYLILDSKGKVLDANQKYVEISGHEKLEDILGRSVIEWTSKDSIENNSIAIQQCITNRGIGGLIVEYVNKKDDSKKFVEINATVYGEGDSLQIVSLCRDITERKQIEKALIEKERLSAIGELAAGVAHDFNNSLQIIFGTIELALLENDVSKEVANYLYTLKNSASDAAVRVQQLQRFNNNNGTNKVYETINLNSLIDNCIEQAKPKWKTEFEKKGLTINIQKDYENINSIDGNIGEISSAFYNLIKNAIESMPNGGKLLFKTGNTNEGVYAQISDTGTGMDEETQKKIFQPFFTTKGYEQGRGLGMTSVYSTIKEHDGNVYIKDSKVGVGTTIEILFPYGTIRKDEQNIEINNNYVGSAKILWVDDEVAINNLGKKMLEKLGYEADTANSGVEALEKLTNMNYDLIITDIGMPNMSGWQLAEQIKEKYSSSKIAVVTGWGANITNEEKEKYGVGYIIGKPINFNQIKNLIGEVIQLKPNKD